MIVLKIVLREVARVAYTISDLLIVMRLPFYIWFFNFGHALRSFYSRRIVRNKELDLFDF